jgi:hypothetical protein
MAGSHVTPISGEQQFYLSMISLSLITAHLGTFAVLLKKNKIFSDGNLDFFLFEIKRPGILSQMLADAGLIHFMATNECRGTNS